jgi:Peptidase M15
MNESRCGFWPAWQPLLVALFVFSASLFHAGLASGQGEALPFPPQRPFDLQLPGGASDRVSPRTVPSTQSPSETPGAASPADPAPRAVTNPPAPPRRPAIAPLSNPAEEEEEPDQTWPRRTPQQREVPFEPRITPPGDVIANGVSTDPGTSVACLPRPLKTVLDAVVARYGAVRVTSTFRPVWRARRNSYHRRCQAMDMRVPGESPRAVLEFVKTLPETGGHKVYWNGLVHVDTGPWRTW